MSDHYDVIIIGTGAGGGTLAHQLGKAGKRILILERGGFLPREKENWNTEAVFLNNRFHTKEVWTDKTGKELHPGTGYWVGGNTKVFGAAMFRLRREDFGLLRHKDGISPEWPVQYDVFEPYYGKAEQLFQVRGQGGIDPTEPARSSPYPYPAVSNEPRLQEIADAVAAQGLKPFPIPLAIKLNETEAKDKPPIPGEVPPSPHSGYRVDADKKWSPCIRCDTCDGYPCLVSAKSDAEINCIRPILDLPNVTLRTWAKVTRINTNATGSAAKSVEVELKESGSKETFRADIIVVACGAINSAALLLQSASDQHPNGLANNSDMVGRHFMFHNSSAMVALSMTPNPARYMKTFGINDFYFGEKDYPYPMGSIQPIASFHHEMLKGDAPPLTPAFVLEMMKTHAVPWWLVTEDLPDPNNRVRIVDGTVQLDYTKNNQESFTRLNERWIDVLKKSGHAAHTFQMHAYFKKYINLEGVGHQNGTCRFGEDPKQSVLDLNCRAHDLDNLYVVDGAFFPSCGAVNPSLTIIANAIRVGDHLIERLK